MVEKGRSPGQGKRAGLPYRDDLLAVGVSRLRASGVITPESTSVVIAFGEGADALRREVRVAHQLFPPRGPEGRRGSWSLFVCPSCSRRARTLRLYDGRLVCRRCDGLIARCQAGKKTEDKEPAIERLRQQLFGGGKIERKRRLLTSLRRKLIVERQKRVLGRNG
jgi:hypothetical protein